MDTEDVANDGKRVEALGLVGAVLSAYLIPNFSAKQILIFCYLFVGTCHWVCSMALENEWETNLIVILVALGYCAFNIHEAFLMKFITENTFRGERGGVVAI